MKIVHGSTSSPIVYLPTDINYPEQEQFNASRSGRVAGGTDAPGAQFPYYVALHFHFGTGGYLINCGGSLISLSHVLSCQHCFPNELRSIDAHLGAQQWGGPSHEVHRVSWYVLHNYNPYVDLAVMGLSKPVTVKPHIAPIALPRLSQASDFFIGREGISAGYGGVNDGRLKQIPIKFVRVGTCGTSVDTLCAVGRDGPQQTLIGGDSGGPAVLRENGKDILVGVVVFTYGVGQGSTRVPLYLPWIRDRTGIPIY